MCDRTLMAFCVAPASSPFMDVTCKSGAQRTHACRRVRTTHAACLCASAQAPHTAHAVHTQGAHACQGWQRRAPAHRRACAPRAPAAPHLPRRALQLVKALLIPVLRVQDLQMQVARRGVVCRACSGAACRGGCGARALLAARPPHPSPRLPLHSTHLRALGSHQGREGHDELQV